MKRQAFILLLLFVTIAGITQNIATLPSARNDESIQKGHELFTLLEKADSVRLSDSIQKLILQRQIDQLLGYEVKRKLELQQELDRISFNDSVQQENFLANIDSLRKTIRGYPVRVFGDSLFPVFSRVGSVTASQRAGLLSASLKSAFQDYDINPDSLKVVTDGDLRDIVYQDRILMSITRDDALWNNYPQDSLARVYRDRLSTAIKSYRESVSFKAITTAIIFSGIVLFCYILLLRLARYLFRKLDEKVIPNVRIPQKWQFFRNYETIQMEKQTRLLLRISKLLRWTINFILTLTVLILIANIVPQTKHAGGLVIGYVLTPLRSLGAGIINYIPNLIKIIIIVFFVWVVIRFIKYMSLEISKENLRIPGFYPEWAKPTFQIIRFFLLVLMIVFVFPFLPGSNSVVFQGISVFIGLVISISSTSIIGNLLAGLVITFMRSFRIGDTIKAGENSGTVVEKTAFVTRIRSFKGENITIPHSNILSSHVINYTSSARESKLILYTTITIGYDMQWQKIHQLMIQAALDTEHILKDPVPFVLQTSLNDYHISYQINAYTRRPELQPRIYSDLHQHIQQRFREAGVEILSPMYNAVRDGKRPEF